MKVTAIRIVISLVGLSLVVIAIVKWFTSSPAVSAMHSGSEQNGGGESIVVACPGRVEGRTDTIDVGAAADGVVQAVQVHEGQTVTKGEQLAEIGCSDLGSALQVARAEAESVRQARARLLKGSRAEERETAEQKTLAARAVLEHTTAELDRATQLKDAAAISRASFEQARRNYEVAAAELKQASRTEALIDAGPTAEDVAKADADLRAAENRIKLAQQRIGKCTVVAPVAGTIVRVNLRAGESFSTVAPHPLFTISDLSGRRIRAEVDERDIGKVHLGQRAILTSEAYPGKRFDGTLTQIASMMGRKTVDTGNPADKSDRDILEALIDVRPDEGSFLPMGLRVTVQFVR